MMSNPEMNCKENKDNPDKREEKFHKEVKRQKRVCGEKKAPNRTERDGIKWKWR
jgi:hypothetical protein